MSRFFLRKFDFNLKLFLDPACGDVNLIKLGITVPPAQEPIFENEIQGHVSRTYIFLGIYVAFNAFWMISSVMLLRKLVLF